MPGVQGDGFTKALMTIDYPHHEIHGGSHFFIRSVQDVSINNVLDIQFTTPNTRTWLHFLWNIITESETNWLIYEGASIVNAGTALTPRNNNRNSSATSAATVAYQSNTSVVNANADTPVAEATLLKEGVTASGSAKQGGDVRSEHEIILRQGTIYCMRAIATAAGQINFHMHWYEHNNEANKPLGSIIK